jgi:tripartite-type tricarboxylate transporter receptor subunit TctC
MKTLMALLTTLSTSLLVPLLASPPAMADGHYPSHPIKIIVPYPAGGTMDAVARRGGQRSPTCPP